MSARGRLLKLERQTTGGEYGDILQLIRKGLYYDELTPEQQKRYCHYHYGERFDDVPEIYLGKLFDLQYNEHFLLERRPPPPTQEEMRERIAEVERIMDEKIEDVKKDRSDEE